MENDHLRILQAVNHLTSMNSMKLISRSGCTKVDDDIVKLILCKLVHLYGDMLMLNLLKFNFFRILNKSRRDFFTGNSYGFAEKNQASG